MFIGCPSHKSHERSRLACERISQRSNASAPFDTVLPWTCVWQVQKTHTVLLRQGSRSRTTMSFIMSLSTTVTTTTPLGAPAHGGRPLRPR